MSRVIRKVSFVIMMCATFVAAQSRVLAMGSYLNDSCYPGTSECSCHENLTYSSLWSMSGSCDFSSAEDPIARGYDYCNGVFSACNSECDNNYPEYVANWWESYGDPWDPYFELQIRPSCWWGFAIDNGCSSGEFPEWTCTCDGFNWCIV